jgi:hypothetical protein
MLRAFLATEDPVSFLDAWRVLRAVGEAVEDARLAELVALHDAPQATRGARTVLGEFLRAQAGERRRERALAERPLTLQHSGRSVRVAVPGQVRLHLAASEWTCEHLGQGLALTSERGPLTVAVQTRGRWRLCLRGGDGRRLDLTVVGE